MPLAKHFKLGLTSCWGSRANHSGDNMEEEKKEAKTQPYDFSQHAEHTVWGLAAAAAAATKHHPTPEDVLVPWSHAAAASRAAEVCTFAPAPGAGRATLFLRTTLTAGTLASRLNRDFFRDLKLSVKKVSPTSTSIRRVVCVCTSRDVFACAKTFGAGYIVLRSR